MVLRATAGIAVVAALAVLIFVVGFRPRDVTPVQPIDFSHKLHAGEYKIGCLYCHINARRSTVAGVPSMQLCMGCHKNVAKNKSGVRNLNRYWEMKRPIEWIKVNDLPDFVYFSHKRHVSADVACQECHGRVENMERVTLGNAHSMKGCVNCHAERSASVDCLTCHK